MTDTLWGGRALQQHRARNYTQSVVLSGYGEWYKHNGQPGVTLFGSEQVQDIVFWYSALFDDYKFFPALHTASIAFYTFGSETRSDRTHPYLAGIADVFVDSWAIN